MVSSVASRVSSFARFSMAPLVNLPCSSSAFTTLVSPRDELDRFATALSSSFSTILCISFFIASSRFPSSLIPACFVSAAVFGSIFSTSFIESSPRKLAFFIFAFITFLRPPPVFGSSKVFLKSPAWFLAAYAHAADPLSVRSNNIPFICSQLMPWDFFFCFFFCFSHLFQGHVLEFFFVLFILLSPFYSRALHRKPEVAKW